MSDYSISWGYIVSRMESLYGVEPNDEEKVAYCDITRHLDYIWQEYYKILYESKMRAKMDAPNNAHWIKQPNGEYKCSVCGDTTLAPLYECRTCGAKMGERRQEDGN